MYYFHYINDDIKLVEPKPGDIVLFRGDYRVGNRTIVFHNQYYTVKSYDPGSSQGPGGIILEDTPDYNYNISNFTFVCRAEEPQNKEPAAPVMPSEILKFLNDNAQHENVACRALLVELGKIYGYSPITRIEFQEDPK